MTKTKFLHRGGPCPVPDMTPIRPVYRGEPSDPTRVRIPFAPAVRLYWAHDGGPDDIVAYYVEELPY